MEVSKLDVFLFVLSCCFFVNNSLPGKDISFKQYHITIASSDNAETQFKSLLQMLKNTDGVIVDRLDGPSIPGLYTFTAHLSTRVVLYVKSFPHVIVEPVLDVAAGYQVKTTTACSTCEQLLTQSFIDEANVSNYGENVTIYVVDTGVEINHVEFGGRASFGCCIPWSRDGTRPVGSHGTHVAGLAAGATKGIARRSDVISVRIEDDSGHSNTSYLVKGLVWIYNNHTERAVALNPNTNIKQVQIGKEPKGYVRPKAVINLSMMVTSPGIHGALALIIKRLKDNGLIIVSAAGNEGSDACDYNRGFSDSAITVGCINVKNRLCKKSNFGQFVPLYALGEKLCSSVVDDSDLYKLDKYGVQIGTSQSSALVSGKVAVFLSDKPEPVRLNTVTKWLVETSAKDIIVFPDYAVNSTNLAVVSGCSVVSCKEPCDRSVVSVKGKASPDSHNLLPWIPLCFIVLLMLIIASYAAFSIVRG